MQKIIVISGPTASGKSELAVKLARKFNGEIISADSRQIYKGLNVGAGKISKKEMLGIPHYLLGIVSPKKIFSVSDFKKTVEKKIKDISGHGKIPIICGGTGLYISAITGGINFPEIKPNWKLRKKLEKKSTEQLFKMLQKLDPKRAKIIDQRNPRRLIRAIEITKASSAASYQPSAVSFQTLFIGIKLSEKELKKRIEKRIEKMLKNGLLNETKKLRKSGLPRKRIDELGFEYKYPSMFLRGEIDKKQMLEKMISANRRYAKRQMAWFKKYLPDARWIKNYKEAEKLIRKFI
jgi:tRNA dimethylallyltransferase